MPLGASLQRGPEGFVFGRLRPQKWGDAMSRLLLCLLGSLSVVSLGCMSHDHKLSEEDRKELQAWRKTVTDLKNEMPGIADKIGDPAGIKDLYRDGKAKDEAIRQPGRELLLGAYHYAGKTGGISAVDGKPSRVRLRSPQGFPEFGDATREAEYDPQSQQLQLYCADGITKLKHVAYYLPKEKEVRFSDFKHDFWRKYD